MAWRAALTSFVPPIALSLLRRERDPLYGSFAEAAAASRSSYDGETLSRFRVERTKLNLAGLTPARLPPAYTLLLAAIHMTEAPRTSVVDFGGGCGEWGYLLRNIARRPFAYTVVESSTMARLCARDPFFEWASFTDSVPSTCDVFVSSGTLQYLADPYALLESAFARTRDFTVLGRNSFSADELFRVQRSRLVDNGFGPRLPPGFEEMEIRYPHRTVNLERVLELARSAGWTLVHEVETASGVLPYRDRVFGRDLMFARPR